MVKGGCKNVTSFPRDFIFRIWTPAENPFQSPTSLPIISVMVLPVAQHVVEAPRGDPGRDRGGQGYDNRSAAQVAERAYLSISRIRVRMRPCAQSPRGRRMGRHDLGTVAEGVVQAGGRVARAPEIVAVASLAESDPACYARRRPRRESVRIGIRPPRWVEHRGERLVVC